MFDADLQKIFLWGDAEDLFIQTVKTGRAQIDNGRHVGHRPIFVEFRMELLTQGSEAFVGLVVHGRAVGIVLTACQDDQKLLYFYIEDLLMEELLFESLDLDLLDQIGDLGVFRGVVYRFKFNAVTAEDRIQFGRTILSDMKVVVQQNRVGRFVFLIAFASPKNATKSCLLRVDRYRR